MAPRWQSNEGGTGSAGASTPQLWTLTTSKPGWAEATILMPAPSAYGTRPRPATCQIQLWRWEVRRSPWSSSTAKHRTGRVSEARESIGAGGLVSIVGFRQGTIRRDLLP
jgi:hypothetical protein